MTIISHVLIKAESVTLLHLLVILDGKHQSCLKQIELKSKTRQLLQQDALKLLQFCK
jgi:hypothetical protein